MKLEDLRKYKEEIINLYINDKLSTYKIANRFDCYSSTVINLLKENNISRRDYGEALRKYSVNEHYLDVIDTQEKAYFLGFFAADGYVNEGGRNINIHLSSVDDEILLKFNKLFENEKPLEYAPGEKNNKGYLGHETSTFIINSVYLVKRMQSLTSEKDKTFTVRMSKEIPEELFSHFIRGYFDGDGSFSKMGKYVKIDITSNIDMCNDIKKVLDNNDIYSKIYKVKNADERIRKVSIQRQNEVKKFLDYIYQDATIFLERKHERYLDYYYRGKPITPYKK